MLILFRTCWWRCFATLRAPQAAPSDFQEVPEAGENACSWERWASRQALSFGNRKQPLRRPPTLEVGQVGLDPLPGKRRLTNIKPFLSTVQAAQAKAGVASAA